MTAKHLDNYYGYIKFFTDESKGPETGQVGAAYVIPQLELKKAVRISNDVSAFTAETVAIILALQWVEEIKPLRGIICTDSLSALENMQSGISGCRHDLIYEIFVLLFKIQRLGLHVKLVWVPAHVGVQGNELADRYAKKALKYDKITVTTKMSKAETITLIKQEIKNI